MGADRSTKHRPEAERLRLRATERLPAFLGWLRVFAQCDAALIVDSRWVNLGKEAPPAPLRITAILSRRNETGDFF